jgi:hypothetical protein
MNIASVGGNEALQASTQGSNVEMKRVQLQAIMLRKSLDAQQQQAQELTQELEGKGQFIDLRV